MVTFSSFIMNFAIRKTTNAIMMKLSSALRNATPSDQYCSDCKCCCLPRSIRKYCSDERHDHVIDQGLHQCGCRATYYECNCKPHYLILVQEILKFRYYPDIITSNLTRLLFLLNLRLRKLVFLIKHYLIYLLNFLYP